MSLQFTIFHAQIFSHVYDIILHLCIWKTLFVSILLFVTILLLLSSTFKEWIGLMDHPLNIQKN